MTPSVAGAMAGVAAEANAGASGMSASVAMMSAGAASAGVGGRDAAGGAADAPLPAIQSPGCTRGSAPPPSANLMKGDRIDTFPADYDGKTPKPLLLALHAAGNPQTQLRDLTRGSRLESDFVRVFPKSSGSAWVYRTDGPKLRAVLDDVLASYCIDTSRIFATGHSSGAQMIVQMLCDGEDRFKAVAPVAASKYCDKLPPVAVLYIQGMHDAQRGGRNGMDVVEVFRTSNLCGPATSTNAAIAGCTSKFDRMMVEPGCVTYEGCAVATQWCEHNDNGYNNTDGRQHGWPCFASSAIADFFLTLK